MVKSISQRASFMFILTVSLLLGWPCHAVNFDQGIDVKAFLTRASESPDSVAIPNLLAEDNVASERASSNPKVLLLEDVSQAVNYGYQPIVVFDLDDTLLDTKPRRLRVLTDFLNLPDTVKNFPAEVARIRPLLSVSIIEKGWQKTLQPLGIKNKNFMQKLSRFSRKHLMSYQYLSRDVAIPGAVNFVRTVLNSGGMVVYITARFGYLNNATMTALRDCGFPLPDGKMVYLYMNPGTYQNTVEYKSAILDMVDEMGCVAGGFENEPENINLFKRKYPSARMMFLHTLHSGPEPPEVLPGIPFITDYFLN